MVVKSAIPLLKIIVTSMVILLLKTQFYALIVMLKREYKKIVYFIVEINL